MLFYLGTARKCRSSSGYEEARRQKEIDDPLKPLLSDGPDPLERSCRCRNFLRAAKEEERTTFSSFYTIQIDCRYLKERTQE